MDTHNVSPQPGAVKPDFGNAAQHIELLTGSAETSICFRVIAPDGTARNINGTLAELWPELERLNLAGWQVYFVVNEGGHNASEITRVRSLFIDMDGAPVPEQWHVEPDFLVRRDETHWHAYWRVNDMPVAAFTGAQKRLIAHYGSDPGIHDLPRILRLAGSIHVKHQTKTHPENDGIPRLVTIEPMAALWSLCSSAAVLAGLPEGVAAESRAAATAAPAELLADDLVDLTEALQLIGNPDLEWDAWNEIGMALFNASGRTEIGKTLWLAFSAKSDKYDEADALKRWDHWFKSPPSKSGAGTIYHLAGQALPGWERPSRRARSQRMFADVEIQAAAGEPGVEPEPISFPRGAALGSIRNARYPALKWVWQDRLRAFRGNLYTGDHGVGKTTLIENLAVAVAAGVPLLGHAVMQMPVYVLVAEDTEGEVRDDLIEIAASLGIDPSVIDDQIWVHSVLNNHAPGGDWLARIDDGGKVIWSPFWREAVLPDLIAHSRGGQCLFMVDPIDCFVPPNKFKPAAAGAYGRSFAQDIACLNGNQITPLFTDHPSVSSMEHGHHVGGDMQFRAGFAFAGTYKKVGDAVETAAGKEHRRELEVLKARRAAETKTTIYRLPTTRALSATGSMHRDQAAIRKRVYRLIIDRLAAGKNTGKTNRSGYGPRAIASVLALTEDEVAQALAALQDAQWLQYEIGAGGGRQGRVGAHFVQGTVRPNPSELDEPGSEARPF
jgi:hypothetical protein